MSPTCTIQAPTPTTNPHLNPHPHTHPHPLQPPVYAPYESNMRYSSSDVYMHEMPGGQYTNLKFQVGTLRPRPREAGPRALRGAGPGAARASPRGGASRGAARVRSVPARLWPVAVRPVAPPLCAPFRARGFEGVKPRRRRHSARPACRPAGRRRLPPTQAASLGLGDSWGKVQKAYAAANRALGDIVKVTPSSKVGAR
jgi:hypothetical protein